MRTGLQAILDDLAAIAGEALVVTDARGPDQPVVYVNPQFERLSGWPANAMLGHNCRMLQGDDFDQPARWQMREAVREARPMRGIVRNYDRRGRAFINEMTVLPLGGTPGEPECFAGFLRDVSSLAERCDDTRPMLPEARRQQGVEALVRKQALAADQTRRLRHWLQVAVTPADRILGGVLDEHLETESQWREAHPFTPDDLLSQVRRRAQRAAPWLRLQVMREPRFPERIQGVRQVLTDVLAGVLGLLCRFHPVAEVRVDMQLQRCREGGMAPVLRVSPSVTGWGRTDAPGSDGGLAWGALGAMSFVELAREARLGGAVLSVDADFTFTLRLDHPVPMQDVHGGPAREEAPSLQVLVGEDDPVNLKMLRGLLERDGHAVRVAEDGEQVLAAVSEQRPDAVFLDLYMPGCDGFEATRRLRQQETERGQRRLPVIAVTAAGMDEAREQSLAAGVDALLSKPVSRDQLRRVLWEHAGRRDGDGGNEQWVSPQAAEWAELDRALRALDYDAWLFRDMLEAFSADFPERVRNLDKALEMGDATEASFLAHTIKGGLSNFSAAEGVGLANALNDQIGRGQMDEGRATMQLLEDAVARFTEWAKSALDAWQQREQSHEQSRDPGRRREASTAGDRTVLVVEDAADTRLMLTEFLRREGYQVVAVEDGERALQHLTQSVPDLMLMDCVMPGMDGLEACRHIKQQEAFADLPVLIITALNDEASAGEAIRAGATDFITKPIFLPVLRQRLRQMALSRERHQRIKYLAYHDALTGLPNRTSFNEGLTRLLDDAHTHGLQHALVYLDLDQFKIVNDTCGHGAGDELLARLAGVLADQVRKGDMVARLGGDEFGVLLRNCRLDDAVGVAEKLVEAARNYVFVWQDQAFFVGASAGLAAVTADGAGAEDLLSAADTACYAAKSSGRDRVQVYCHEGGQVLLESEQIQLVPRINRALEEDRFALYRQQIVALVPEADEMPHYEVLVRMLGESGELIAPGSFIAAAERYQVMPRVDRWVVRRALQGIREAHLDRGQPARYSLNLSGTTVGEKGFADFLEAVIRDTGVPPEWLCFEITETATIRRLETAVDFIERIRALGCSFALDDFGAGLSSFGYLKTLPVDYIKIDGRFVRELLVDTFDQAMVEAMQRIGSVMGIETIAEFVEDEAVIDRLRDIGVRYAQGFGIHRPEPFV